MLTRAQRKRALAGADGPSSPANADGLEGMTVAQLRKRLRTCGVATAGKRKGELVLALRSHLQQVERAQRRRSDVPPSSSSSSSSEMNRSPRESSRASKGTKREVSSFKEEKLSDDKKRGSEGMAPSLNNKPRYLSSGLRSSVLGLLPELSLRTIDETKTVNLLPKASKTLRTPAMTKVVREGSRFLCTLSGLLTPAECQAVASAAAGMDLKDLAGTYSQKHRNGARRLVGIDASLAGLIWSRISPSLEKLVAEEKLSCQPLGFSVSNGEWKLDKVNPAIRVSTYDHGGFFSPHFDAQYCPSTETRGLLSVLVYLNAAPLFEGGETVFYFPKPDNRNMLARATGATVSELIKDAGGLKTGFKPLKVTPEVGSAILFTPNILHEGLPTDTKSRRWKTILRTDILVTRRENPQGFAPRVGRELDAYKKCLDLFREAQNRELDGSKESANALYERTLSIRYSFPEGLRTDEEYENGRAKTESFSKLFGTETWKIVFDYLDFSGAEVLAAAVPELLTTLGEWRCRTWANVNRSAKKNESTPFWLPTPGLSYGCCTMTVFPSASFFTDNPEGCARVAAMEALMRFGTGFKNSNSTRQHTAANIEYGGFDTGGTDKYYTVNYNPRTQQATYMSAKSLLWAAFHERQCFGAVYRVMQSTGDSTCDDKDTSYPCERNAQKDFSDSVSRTYMCLRHGAEFIGRDFQSEIRCASTGEPDKYCVDEYGDDAYISHETLRINRLYNREQDKVGPAPFDEFTLQGVQECLWEKKFHTPEKYLSTIMHGGNENKIGFDEFARTRGQVTSMCACGIGGYEFEISNPQSKIIKDSTRLNECRRINHLVFDFASKKLKVKIHGNSGPAKEDICYRDSQGNIGFGCSLSWGGAESFWNVMRGMLSELTANSSSDSVLMFTVNIADILSPAISFNHASCQCGFPEGDVDALTLLCRSELTHVHIVAQETSDGKMAVVCRYGGVVAF